LKNQLNVEDYKVVKICDKTQIQKILSLLENRMPIVPDVRLIRKNVARYVKTNIGKVVQALEKIEKMELLKSLQSSGRYLLSYEGGELDLNSGDLELSYDSAEGYAMSERDNMIVFIATERDEDLTAKGLLRDLARNLQQLRKECGYNPTEIISSAFIANLEENEISVLSQLREELMYLVRVKSVIFSKEPISKTNSKIVDLEGRKLKICLE
jgi:isoleucyl-tRNA synthetase